MAYFTPFKSHSLFKYELDSDKWTQLPLCPQENFGLAIIRGLVTAIGGIEAGKSSHTNTLTSYDGTQWLEAFPPMLTPRSRPAVVNSSDGVSVVAAGGSHDDGDWGSNAVEHYNTETQQWTALPQMPMRLPGVSAVLCGDQLYLLNWESSVYTCSLQALITHSQLHSHTATPSLWRPLPAVPTLWSTPVNVGGKLVVVGGHTRPNPTNAVHLYDKGKWTCIGHMFLSRRDSIVVAPRDDIIMVLGGLDAKDSATDDVEILLVTS